MTDDNYIKILCSTTSNQFTLLFDGLETYYLFYQGMELAKIKEPVTPSDLHKNYIHDKGLDEIKEDDSKSEVISIVLKELENELGNDRFKILGGLKSLFGTLKDVQKGEYKRYINTAPNGVKDKFLELTSKINGDDSIIKEIINPMDSMEQRANPILTPNEKAIADAIADEIDNIGLLPYLDNILKDIHIGEHKNIYRKILMLFKIMKGDARFLSETTAKAEAGKSFEDEIVFGLIAPQRYIFKVNDITPASFRRYASIDPYYFDRQIIVFGDLGSKKSFKHLEDVFNIFKVLITEKEYNSTISDKVGDSWENLELNLKVNSIGAVYSTTKTGFTDGDEQLISRTIFSTPAIVEDIDIMKLQFYLKYSKSRQSKARAKAEQKLKEFGLYLMSMVNTDIEIINPYLDVFITYALKSESPKRELNQQLELFDAYCILTKDKAVEDAKGSLFASLEQLKEYMDYINLENALIPYEYDFLQMIMAKGKSNELRIVYEIDPSEVIGNADLLTLIECENYAIELLDTDYAATKEDLSPKELKSLPYKLIAGYGLRAKGLNHKEKAFFRISDIQGLYYKYSAFKNGGDISKLLQSLYKKGYLGKYEYKHNKENIYYLTPLCESILTKFKPKKSYDQYVTDYIANVGYENL